MKQKKGIELNQAFGAVLTLVLVAVLVIIAIVIFVSLATTFTGTSSASITNETITQAALTAGGDSVTLGGVSNCSSSGFSISNVFNDTTAYVIDSGNYTLTSAGVLTNTTNTFSLEDWLVSYSYTWGSEACTASENITDEFSNYTSLIGLVGTIIFLGLVIGILVAAFAFGGGRKV